MESHKYPGVYANSADLARATPHIRLSRPTPPDNTEWFDHDNQVVREPAKVCLCFDCQLPIEAGKGVQVKRDLGKVYGDTSDGASCIRVQGIPCEAIVHPLCNTAHEINRDVCELAGLGYVFES